MRFKELDNGDEETASTTVKQVLEKQTVKQVLEKPTTKEVLENKALNCPNCPTSGHPKPEHVANPTNEEATTTQGPVIEPDVDPDVEPDGEVVSQ